jgi:DNA-binding beta-propeller fold protein YncE
VAFSTEESGPIRAFSIAASGALAEAPGSPYQPPSQLYPPGFDPAKRFALGITAFPKAPVVYISMTTIPALAVYTFTPTGALTIQSAVPVAGAYLPCWLVITPNGHFLFTSNADTDNVTVFDLDNPLRPKQIQTLPFKTPGNPWQEAIDPTGHFLFVNTPRDTLKTPPGTGNTQHVMQIGAEGQLTELNATSPTKIPVPDGANPQGIAIVPGPGTA